MTNPIISYVLEFQKQAENFFNEWWWVILIGLFIVGLFLIFRIFIQGAGL